VKCIESHSLQQRQSVGGEHLGDPRLGWPSGESVKEEQCVVDQWRESKGAGEINEAIPINFSRGDESFSVKRPSKVVGQASTGVPVRQGVPPSAAISDQAVVGSEVVVRSEAGEAGKDRRSKDDTSRSLTFG